MPKPATYAFTVREGGNWLPFNDSGYRASSIHSILFVDGSMWDSINGWRPNTKSKKEMMELDILFAEKYTEEILRDD